MASSFATAVYGMIAGWILLNSILESHDRGHRLAGYGVMAIVAAAWPLIFLAWPVLTWSVPTRVNFAALD